MRYNRIPENLLLRSAPRGKRASTQLKHFVFETGDQLWRADSPTTHVLFPSRGVVSLQLDASAASDGKPVEIGLVGPEGFAEVTFCLGTANTRLSAVALTDGEALVMDGADLFDGYLRNVRFRDAVHRYARMFLVMLNHIAVCNRIHGIEKTLIGRLLLIQDRTHVDSFYLTQDFLSRVLGVRKASISRAAARLKKEGVIQYDRRGRLIIADRKKLERHACSCYRAIKAESDDLVEALGGL